MFRDSVEIDEQKYPLRVKEIRIRTDSEGAGRRRGAPGAIVAYGPKVLPMTTTYVTDGFENPPRGVRGGGDAARSIPYRIFVDGTEGPLDPIGAVVLEPGELIGHKLSGGGGYGNPLERESELVRNDVLSRFLSFAKARDVYGVVFKEEILTDSLEVDDEVTFVRRAELRTGNSQDQSER
jgi:N-methylhydantoinase B